MVAVEVEDVSKQFRRSTVQPYTTLKSALVDFFQGRKKSTKADMLHALRGVTLTVRQGQTLGIIGRNGSGKSTLLKLLAGIYRPDQGRIHVSGRLGALLELGTGFHPEFSGRENVFINGIVLGLSKREIRRRFKEIVCFADLEEFIDEPVKTYSTGMYMRLGFAISVHADPDILLIDEILAVGDNAFQQKCFDKIAEFRRHNKTIILVSHDLASVERWCDEVLWLDNGMLREQGDPHRVIGHYREDVSFQEGKTALAEHHRIEETVQGTAVQERSNRWGSQEVAIISVKMLDTAGQERYVYNSGEPARVVIRYHVHHPVEEPVFGIAILRGDGLLCYGSNTDIERIALPSLAEEGTVEIFLERLELLAGVYYLDVAVHSRDGYPYDYHHQLYTFSMRSDLQEVGVFRVPHHWLINPGRSALHQSAVSD